jgi:hypothetical protein
MNPERDPMPRQLGLRPPKLAPRLELHKLLAAELGAIPPYPEAADHLGLVEEWGLYGNDEYGTCGPTSVANYLRLVSKYLTGVQVDVPQDAVFDLYRRSGNPNFSPVTGDDDNGVDMQTMLEAFAHGGLAGIRPVAFAAVDPRNPSVLRAAVSIFGGVLLGSVLDVAQDVQYMHHENWDPVQGSAIWGGHATLLGKYKPTEASDDFTVVTWATLQGLTDEFVMMQNQEAWVVIMEEHFGTVAFQEGIDQDALREDYRELTGRDLPFRPAPNPSPNPEPPEPVDPDLEADLELVKASRQFRMKHHSGEGENVRKALQRWMMAHDYADS